MEVMEEGNLMDRVPILLQRDLQYYQKNQTVLQESICSGIVGGRLDFPRNASFASVKLVMWWEEEYVAAFRMSSGLFNTLDSEEESGAGCGGIVKNSDPDKFVAMVVKSADLLLEHLHVLSQEALDHADLPVLTATLGAAALIKNSLHCYVQASQHTGTGGRIELLQKSQKQYSEMAEALAERLLDLHGRLLALYVLQGKQSEEGSHSIRLWWLYMQGTRQDLWDTVPPKMAQRVFAGMLNETLTILAVRYTQELPIDNRNSVMMNDILNILLCVSQLLPAICTKAEELVGLNLTSLGKVGRDIHAKCHKLLVCLLLRGSPLHYLYKVFKQPTGVHLFETRHGCPSLWYILSMPHLFSNSPDCNALSCQDLSTRTAIALELYVFISQPQPLWPLLLKILLMRDCFAASKLLKHCIQNMDDVTISKENAEKSVCEGFLCPKDGSCSNDKTVTFAEGALNGSSTTPSTKLNAEVVSALTHIVLSVCSESDMKGAIISALESTGTNWAASLDRRQLWVLKHPPWLSAILALVKPILPPIVETTVGAIQTGASIYQAMSLCLTCFSQLWDCLPQCLLVISKLISDVLPATSTPVGGSVLLQFLVMGLYEEMVEFAEAAALKETKALTPEPEVSTKNSKKRGSLLDKKSSTKKKEKTALVAKPNVTYSYSVSFDGSLSSVSSVATSLAEALCSIDEDNKHTEQIQKFIKQTQKPVENNDDFSLEGITELIAKCYQVNPVIESVETFEASEAMVSQLLMTPAGRNSLQVMHRYLLKHADWLLGELGAADHLPLIGDKTVPVSSVSLLYTMFYVGRRPFDQFLHGSWVFDWTNLLNTPLSLTAERVWMHVSRRPEFQPEASLSLPDAAMTATISAHLKDIVRSQ